VYRHARGLIDHEEILVLVEDTQGHLLRLGQRRDGSRELHREALAALEPVAGLAPYPSGGFPDEALLDQALGLGARDLAEARDSYVEALAGAVGGDLEQPVSRRR
jgi:hypothetical protein